MAKRTTKTLWNRSFERTLKAMTRTAVRAGAKVIKDSLRCYAEQN